MLRNWTLFNDQTFTFHSKSSYHSFQIIFVSSSRKLTSQSPSPSNSHPPQLEPITTHLIDRSTHTYRSLHIDSTQAQLPQVTMESPHQPINVTYIEVAEQPPFPERRPTPRGVGTPWNRLLSRNRALSPIDDLWHVRCWATARFPEREAC